MITEWDDFPVHQTSDPVAFPATSDRNFYDRYFFHGYDIEKRLFFGFALGCYPNRAIVDSAFSVVLNGQQHIVRASKRATDNHRALGVGPLHVQVLEPLRVLRILVEENQWQLRADLQFAASVAPIEEPRFRQRSGTRLWMDYTRMTQHGTWSGWIEVRGLRVEIHPQQVLGARDRSWGVRPVGEPDAGVPSLPMQFFWLWGPFHLPNAWVHFAVSEYADGQRWHECASVIQRFDESSAPRLLPARVRYQLRLRRGTRQIDWAEVWLEPEGSEAMKLEIQPVLHFYMAGLGYGHPEWGHGRYVGDDVVGGETWDLAAIDPAVPFYFHIQSLARVRAGTQYGCGVLEQLIIGPHAPTGLTGLFDPAS